MVFCVDGFACEEQKQNYVAYYKNWNRAKPGTYYLYVPKVKGEHILTGVEVEYLNQANPLLTVFAEVHDPSKYEESDWYENYMAAIITISKENMKSLRVQARYGPKDQEKVLLCEDKVTFTFENMRERL